jgi:phytoene dehydrogenase-like protein
MVRVSPDKKTMLALVNSPFKNKNYWNTNKEKLIEDFIDRIEKYAIPELSKHIIYREAATPYTLYRYTLNYKGAAYGWACTPSQLAVPGLSKPPFIQGLYLVGHWITQGAGIPGCVYLGYESSKLLIRKEYHIKEV